MAHLFFSLWRFLLCALMEPASTNHSDIPHWYWESAGFTALLLYLQIHSRRSGLRALLPPILHHFWGKICLWLCADAKITRCLKLEKDSQWSVAIACHWIRRIPKDWDCAALRDVGWWLTLIYSALTLTHPWSRDRKAASPFNSPGRHPPNYHPQLSQTPAG